jgi:sterol desaturase/sphingolipid hydroxylase (fatty acid hydroxylase superfamily)
MIATPAFHHWHHTNEAAELLNKNYAALLPLVDRVFGTLYLPRDRHPRSYGIDEPLSPGLLGQLVDPFVAEARRQPASGRTPSGV